MCSLAKVIHSSNIQNNTFTMAKKEDFHPLSINIKKLQRFNFKLLEITDIIYFEWLILMSSLYGFNEFYRKDIDVNKDLNIKRTKLDNAREKFKKLGFLIVVVKGLPSIHYYSINYDILLNNLEHIYQKEYISDVKKYFLHFLRKSRINYSLDQKDENRLIQFIKELEKIYFPICTNRKFKNDFDTLKYDKRILKLLHEIRMEYSETEIHKSFTNYTHSIINNKSHPKDVLKLFTALDDYNNKFLKFEYHLEVFEKTY